MFWVITLILIGAIVILSVVDIYRSRSYLTINNPVIKPVMLVLFVLFVISTVVNIFLPFNHYELTYTDSGRKIVIATIMTACTYGGIVVAIWLVGKGWFKYLCSGILTIAWVIAAINPLVFTDWLVNG